MSIKFEDFDDVSIVWLGALRILDEPAMADAIEQITAHAAKRGARKFLLSFNNVEYLSSGALAKLIDLHKKLHALKCRMSLCNVIPQIREVFAITKLDKVFRFADDPGIDEPDDDPDAETDGVGARLKPPKPSGGGRLHLPEPPPEME